MTLHILIHLKNQINRYRFWQNLKQYKILKGEMKVFLTLDSLTFYFYLFFFFFTNVKKSKNTSILQHSTPTALYIANFTENTS